MTFYVYTIADTITGELIRYIIAEAGVTLGLDISETVSRRQELVDFVGGGKPESASGDELAAGLWGERQERP